jgi:hypothetical protein
VPLYADGQYQESEGTRRTASSLIEGRINRGNVNVDINLTDFFKKLI